MNKISEFIISGFYSGRIPKAPGTMGSIIYFLLWLLILPKSLVLNIVYFISITAIGFLFVEYYLKTSGIPNEEDPQFIVIDEWAGLSFALIPFSTNEIFFPLVALILFRIFDINKPWIIGKADKVHGTTGIMLDDIIAGFFTLIIGSIIFLMIQ